MSLRTSSWHEPALLHSNVAEAQYEAQDEACVKQSYQSAIRKEVKKT